MAARQQHASMQDNLNKAVERAKRELRDAISVAKRTRNPVPLAACLETAKADELLWQSFKDLIQEADNLLQELRDAVAVHKAAVGVGTCLRCCVCVTC